MAIDRRFPEDQDRFAFLLLKSFSVCLALRPPRTKRAMDEKATGKHVVLDASLTGLIAELRANGRASRSTRERLAGEFADEVMNTAREIATVNPQDIGTFVDAVHSAAVEIPNPIQDLITAECQAERNLLARLVRAVSKS